MVVVEKLAFAVAASALAGFVVVSGALVAANAAPEPQVGPDGRTPAWVEDERSS